MQIFQEVANKVGITEQDVIDLIYKIIDNIGKRYTFGHFDINDIKQEAIFLAVDGLENYNPEHSLESFLYVHLRNRLYSFRRNKYHRGTIDCRYCGNEGCQKCERRHLRMDSKKNIIEPISTTDKEYQFESSVTTQEQPYHEAIIAESVDLIDKHLPMELRPYYLRMLDGGTVAAVKRREVEKVIVEILNDRD
jgi:DNA-directed RNA polymerase specialized sigma24 family protein